MGGLRAPEQGWKNPLAMADIEWPEGLDIHITITDETGKFPLNKMASQHLNLLFDELRDIAIKCVTRANSYRQRTAVRISCHSTIDIHMCRGIHRLHWTCAKQVEYRCTLRCYCRRCSGIAHCKHYSC